MLGHLPGAGHLPSAAHQVLLTSPHLCTRATCCAAPATFNITSAIGGSTYILSTSAASEAEAQAFCNDQGGHLASYESLEEQYEVEQAFVARVGSSWLGLLPSWCSIALFLQGVFSGFAWHA